MNDFWKSYDITHAEYGADYRCYPLYGTVHLMELAISLAFIVGAALWYRRSSARTRRRILVGVTALLLLDEAALLLGMALTGQWNWSYLPLHLCNINVFVCLYNTITFSLISNGTNGFFRLCASSGTSRNISFVFCMTFLETERSYRVFA